MQQLKGRFVLETNIIVFMDKNGQLEKVKARILEVGYVDNFWAIDNYILRLGAIIFKLRKSGMILKGSFGKELGHAKLLWKNYYYVEEKPGQQTLC